MLNDELIGREAFERFQTPGMIAGMDEELKAPTKFSFDGPVHSLDLTIRRTNDLPDPLLILLTPRMVRLGQAVLDPILGTDAVDTNEQVQFAFFGPDSGPKPFLGRYGRRGWLRHQSEQQAEPVA